MRPSTKPLPLKGALDRSSQNYQILIFMKKAGVDFHQFLVLSAISHSPLKLFKVQSSKAYGKSGAALATLLLMAMCKQRKTGQEHENKKPSSP